MSRTLPYERMIPVASRRRRAIGWPGANTTLLSFGIVFSLLMTGCGQVMIRQDSCKSAPLVGIVDGIDGESTVSCQEGCAADRLALTKAKLGWQGERLTSGVGRCSDKISEYWYSSRIAQWAAKHREQANAPPLPKFHPIPTHPALFPEQDASGRSLSIPIVSDQCLETVD